MGNLAVKGTADSAPRASANGAGSVGEPGRDRGASVGEPRRWRGRNVSEPAGRLPKDALSHSARMCYNPVPPRTRTLPEIRRLAGRATLMKNFLRVLRVSWTYRGRLLLSLACALL